MFKYREHMLSYCLNCKQDSESINRKKKSFYQNVQCVIVKNQDLLKNKKWVIKKIGNQNSFQ